MRIISDTHDYYDAVAAHGANDDLVYLRTPKYEQIQIGAGTMRPEERAPLQQLLETLLPAKPGRGGKAPHGTHDTWIAGAKRNRVQAHVLVVANEARVVWSMAFDLWNLTQDARRNTGNADIQCASSADVRTAADRTIPALRKTILAELKQPCGTHWGSSGRSRAEILDDIRALAPIAELLRRWSDRPILHVHDAERKADGAIELTVESDVPIGRYGAARIWPPATVYQNLSRWVANQARPEQTTVGIDDKHLAEKKGFDQQSFRRESGTPKHRTRRDRGATSTTATDQSGTEIPQTRENNSKTGTKTRDRVATASQRWAGHKVQTSTPEKQTEQQRPAATPKDHETQYDR